MEFFKICVLVIKLAPSNHAFYLQSANHIFVILGHPLVLKSFLKLSFFAFHVMSCFRCHYAQNLEPKFQPLYELIDDFNSSFLTNKCSLSVWKHKTFHLHKYAYLHIFTWTKYLITVNSLTLHTFVGIWLSCLSVILFFTSCFHSVKKIFIKWKSINKG